MLNFESIKNKTVLLRCDFNEPLKELSAGLFELESTKRIDSNIITAHELLARNNKVILLSHHSDKNQTLLPVFNYLQKSFDNQIEYIQGTEQEVIKKYFDINKSITQNENKKIFLLENTRLFYSLSPLERGLGGEDKTLEKNLDEKNDPDFANFLASLGEVFVYDAFSVGHRNHASTTGVAQLLPSCFGPTFLKEYNALSKVQNNLSESLVFMGGAKLSTKLPMVNRFLGADATVCLGGAMIHEILKSENNKNKIDIKNSYLEKDFKLSDEALGKLLKYIEDESLILPEKLIWNSEYDKIVDNIFNIEKLEEFLKIKNIKNILWNGPVGMYEESEISGSAEIYKIIIKNKNIFTVVGGGDSLALLQKLDSDFEQNFSYVSLSGGAMLEFLSTGTLPILSHILIKNVI